MKIGLKSPLFFVIFAFIGLMLMAGCKPVCEASSLQKPVLVEPVAFAVVPDLAPSLNWAYPDTTCYPESYRINLFAGPQFNINVGGGTGTHDTSWGPGSPLQPHTEYEWSVQAFVGTTLGPESVKEHFFTGPVCTGNLVAPVVVKPLDQAVVNSTDVEFLIDYPGDCLAPGYYFKVASNPQFSADLHFEQRDNPNTTFLVSGLNDCTTYYWNVTAQVNGVKGPFSPTTSFKVDVNGTCSQPHAFTLEKTLFYCVEEPELDMAEFYFTEPISGNLEVQFDDHVYPCIFDNATPGRVICYGQHVSPNQPVTLQLMDVATGEVLASLSGKTPDCIGPAVPASCSKYSSKESCNAQPTCTWVSINIPSAYIPPHCVNK